MTIDPGPYRRLFQAEAEEHLVRLNRELLRLEADAPAPGAVDEIFRSLHTLKGMAAALGYERLAALAHALESLFEPLRQADRAPDQELIDLAFAGVDALESALPAPAAQDFADSAAALVRRIAQRVAGDSSQRSRDAAAADRPATGAADPIGARLDEPRPARRGRAAGAVRVDRGRLDRLLNQAGELVIAGQRLEELGRAIGRADLAQAIRRASGLANGLQQEALASRMAPVGTVLERFPRGVRDRARRLGRSVEFEVTGGEIELDRAILDEIAEPLMHLLNNAVDHGIESPDEREARGKPRTGAVRLGVLREGQNVALEVSDDGRGLDRARLLEVALARGLVAETQLGGLPDEEVNRIATLSGVSTAASVSESSGRGVGLDAVQAAATRLGGVLTIRSVEGSGTAFTLRLPATLAAMRCLLVESWGSRYAIPLGYVREMTWAPSGRGAGESPAVVARGQRVACLPLGEAVGAVRPAGPPEAGALAVVFQVADEPLALWVSRVLGTREIVVRRLHPLKGVRLPFNGVTALGDGSLALLVDAARLASASPLSQAAAGAGPRAGEGSE